MRRDWIAGLVLLGIAGLYYAYATEIPRSALSDAVGAASFPKLLAALLAVLSLLLIGNGLLAKQPAMSPEQRSKQRKADLEGFVRAGGTLALGIGYLLIISWTGYAVAVALLLAAMLAYNGMKLTWHKAVLCVVGGGFFWLVFRVALDIPLPAGILPDVFGI